MGDGIERIERNRLLEGSLGGTVVAARALDQSEGIPDGGGARSGFQRPFEISKGALEIVVDVIAVVGARLERSRVVWIDR